MRTSALAAGAACIAALAGTGLATAADYDSLYGTRTYDKLTGFSDNFDGVDPDGDLTFPPEPGPA